MDFDLTKIGEEEAKLHGMTKEQSKGEVQYKMALKMLDILMRRGIVSEEEYKKIDHMNRQSFSPQLAKKKKKKHLLCSSLWSIVCC